VRPHGLAKGGAWRRLICGRRHALAHLARRGAAGPDNDQCRRCVARRRVAARGKGRAGSGRQARERERESERARLGLQLHGEFGLRALESAWPNGKARTVHCRLSADCVRRTCIRAHRGAPLRLGSRRSPSGSRTQSAANHSPAGLRSAPWRKGASGQRFPSDATPSEPEGAVARAQLPARREGRFEGTHLGSKWTACWSETVCGAGQLARATRREKLGPIGQIIEFAGGAHTPQCSSGGAVVAPSQRGQKLAQRETLARAAPRRVAPLQSVSSRPAT